MLSADSFLTLFLGLELMSLPVYVMVLLAIAARPRRTEAALKYLVLGGTATAMLLMGVSLLFGYTGSLSLDAFAPAARHRQPDGAGGGGADPARLLPEGRDRAVPHLGAGCLRGGDRAGDRLHVDRDQGCRAARRGAAVRRQPLSGRLVELLAILSLASIVWGNLAAMQQTSFRRMIAYSSIAHAGYLFFAFLGDGEGRFQAVAFYALVYGLMNMLAFAALPTAADDVERDRLDNLKGLYQRAPFAAVMIALAMFSLAGIPPLPGFVAKFLIFRNVIEAGFEKKCFIVLNEPSLDKFLIIIL